MRSLDEAGLTTASPISATPCAARRSRDRFHFSGNPSAAAPVAEELEKATVFFDWWTPVVFRGRELQHVFPQPVATATMDSIGAALYVTGATPS